MRSAAPLSVVIPALDAAATLPACLASLDEGRSGGLIREIVLVDGGSSDGTLALARRLGATVLDAPRGRGAQLAAGARATRGGWLLFLHADTRLSAGWSAVVAAYLARPGEERAGYFRLALDDAARSARFLERVVALRARLLGLPYGDQGLLLSRQLYERTGGFRPLPLMEDVDFVRRLGRQRLRPLAATATTSARRYQQDGYAARMLRNVACLALYFLGMPPRIIAKLYA